MVSVAKYTIHGYYGVQDPMVRSGNYLDVPLEAIRSKGDGGISGWVISPQGMISPFFYQVGEITHFNYN